MKKFLKKNSYLLLVYIIVFIILYFLGFNHNYGDPLNNYGYSYALAKGEIPYLDFNLLTTPLYAFIMSIGLHLCNNYLIFLLEHTLLVTIAYYLLTELFGKKVILMLLVTFLSSFTNIIPTYNFMCIFMIIVLLYLEKNYNDKDYLIGFCIALALFSKQTVGFFTIIPTLIYYWHNKKKILKRIVGFLIPCFIFLLYLIINNCVFQFFDLCLFGLLDFFNKNGIKNGEFNMLNLLFTFIFVIIMILLNIKNKKDINISYLLTGVFFSFPLFDKPLFFNCFFLSLLPYIKINNKIISRITLTICFISSILYVLMWPLKVTFTSKLNHFNFNIHTQDKYESILKINKFINKYDNDNLNVIGYFSMHYDLINDKKITYLSILNDGNYGYNGTKKMITRIKNMHNHTFAVSIEDYKSKNKKNQFTKEIASYIINNCEKIDEKYGYEIYYKH